MENLTNFCVYMHTNRINGKRYIGITGMKPTNRWANGTGYKRCPIFYAAIKKYGWDAFQHDILYTGLTQEEAERLEVELIAKYQTQDRDKGYNFASGGGVNRGFHRTEDFTRRRIASRKGWHPSPEQIERFRKAMTGRKLSEEHKEKLRRAQTGKVFTEEHRRHMSEAKKGEKHPAYGKHLSAEHRAKISASLNAGGKDAFCRKVVDLDTGEVFRSIREAAAVTGAQPANIAKCCKGVRNKAAGRRWGFADEVVSRNG